MFVPINPLEKFWIIKVGLTSMDDRFRNLVFLDKNYCFEAIFREGMVKFSVSTKGLNEINVFHFKIR